MTATHAPVQRSDVLVDSLEDAGSLPGLLLRRAQATPDRVAIRHHREGVWAETTWAEYARHAAEVGLGLASIGVRPGDRVAIHSDNRPEWLYADLGAQGIGAVPVGIYPTSPPAELEYLLGHCDAVVLVAEDEEQLDKALAVRDRLPALQRIVVIDPTLVTRHLDDPRVMTFAELAALGAAEPPEAFAERVAALDIDGLATLVYTSGTTGPPKGAMLSHRNLLSVAASLAQVEAVSTQDEILSYLPLCHIAERTNSLIDALWFGAVVNFGKGSDTFASDLAEVQPTAFLGVPRVWEKMLAAVEIHMADASWLKRTTYSFWMRQGQHVARRRMDGTVRAVDWLRYAIGWVVLYRPLRAKLGLRRTRLAISGAAPIAPEVLEFFWALGVTVREAYGQTENTALATFTPRDRVKIGKVGRAMPGVEIRIAEDGEICTRSSGNFLGYFDDPAATAAAVDEEGWLRTGDIGHLDEDGFLQITDRKKDLIITAGGKNISPSEIENRLKVSPYVREAIVIGDGRKYLTALVGIELDTVGDWATRRQIPYTTYEDLSAKPEVRDLVAEWVEHVNHDLAQVEQVKDFRLLPGSLDHENGQLTATQKVKRRAISDQFGALVEEMYA
jgi:long-chain acyl-CoA synthetase